MSKTLIAYFSATGTTAQMAKTLSKDIGADLFEIKPKTPYSKKDLNWVNPLSRTTKEYVAKTKVAIANESLNIGEYDTIILGFPIWFFKEPNVILTFLSQYDFGGKTMSFFVTSHKAGIEKSANELKKVCPNAHWKTGLLANGKTSEELKSWATTIK